MIAIILSRRLAFEDMRLTGLNVGIVTRSIGQKKVVFSDAHFRRSPVIDRLKSRNLQIPKDRLFNPPQDLGPMNKTVSCPIVFMVQRTSLPLFPNKIQAFVQRKRHVDQCIWTAEAPCLG